MCVLRSSCCAFPHPHCTVLVENDEGREMPDANILGKCENFIAHYGRRGKEVIFELKLIMFLVICTSTLIYFPQQRACSLILYIYGLQMLDQHLFSWHHID